MKRLHPFLIAIVAAVVIPQAALSAVIVTAAPNPAAPGQPVTVTVVSEFLAGAIPPCSVPIDFGDGSPQAVTTTNPLNCPVAGTNVNCITSTTHTYAAPGVFTISANDTACAGPAVPILPTSGSAVMTVSAASASGNVSPAAVSVPAGEPAARVLTYSFSGGPPGQTQLTSPAGTFLVAGNPVSSVPAPVTATLMNGRGFVTENLTIPVSVLEKALRSGSGTATFTRTFSNTTAGISVTLSATILATGAGTADFAVSRIALSFDGRGTVQKTVARDESGLKGYAEIRFVGTGVLQGFWEVDARILSTVTKQLVPGGNAVIETPAAPPLPTFDPGTHVLRFVVTSPGVGFEMPAIIYTVLPEAKKETVEPISLTTPDEGALLDFHSPVFGWLRLSGAGTYEIRFFPASGEKPLFTAFTDEPSYTVPPLLLRNLFSPGSSYSWDVRLIRDGKPVNESRKRTFRFREPLTHVPGQLLVAVKGDDGKAGGDLARRFGLKVVEVFPLSAVGLTGLLLQADGTDDVTALAKLLRDQPGVVAAQPNYYLRLMGKGTRIGSAGDLLRLDLLHKGGSGRGVRVAVLDTGVDDRHRNLRERIVRSANFVRGEEYRREIHGTAVAGIIAAGENGSGQVGVAPGADILALRACRQHRGDTPEGECTTDALARGLNEAIVQRADIVNMSFGKPGGDPLLARLLDAGMEKGVVFVASAGNGAGDSLVFPASHPGVVSVAGLDDRLRPYPTEAMAAKATVSAPAVAIFTTVPGDRYNYLSGTSFSSAYVSGLLALAREKRGGLKRESLPKWRGELCGWEEELLKVSVCGK